MTSGLRSIGDKSRRRIRTSLRARDGDDCYLCRGLMVFNNTKSEDYATIDHILPRSQGGSNDLDNLKLAHRKCNLRRGNDANVTRLSA